MTVTAPGSRITSYTYNAADGQPGNHALLTEARPDGTHQYYTYDGQGRLSAAWRDGNAERVGYAYDAFGRIAITDANNQTAKLSPDEYGTALSTDPLGRHLDLF